MSISVIGAGAFGTALAVTLANDGHAVTLYARSAEAVAAMDANRSNPRLPDVSLPKAMTFTNDFVEAAHADVILLAVPTQTLVGVITANAQLLANKSLVACCKGIDIGTLSGPVAAISSAIPTATAAMLTGPSFAADIARGLPTALTLACTDAEKGQDLQQLLSTKTLRLYRTTDTIGAELGGALKNVIAISCWLVCPASEIWHSLAHRGNPAIIALALPLAKGKLSIRHRQSRAQQPQRRCQSLVMRWELICQFAVSSRSW